MRDVGYAALKRIYSLRDIPHQVVSHIVQGARRTVDDHEYYPAVYQPEESLAGHLEFAFKYEGGNLTVLNALFSVVDPDELLVYIQSRPTGIHTRRVWFFRRRKTYCLNCVGREAGCSRQPNDRHTLRSIVTMKSVPYWL